MLVQNQMALVAGAVIWQMRGAEDTAQPAPEPAPVPVPTAASQANTQLEELIRRADAEFAARRYVAASGDSAADLYSAALALSAGEPRATGGFERSIELALSDAESAFTAGRLEEVDGLLTGLLRADPDNPHLAFLKNQLQRERERSGSEASRRQALESAEAQLRTALARASERLRRGSLIEPARDGALFHYRAAEALRPGDAGVRAMRDNLVSALIAQAGEDLDASRATAARRMIDTAAALDARAAGLDAIRDRLDATTRPATPAIGPPAATPPPAAIAPADTQATSASTPVAANGSEDSARAGGAVSAAQLPRLSAPAAVYPEQALEALVSGWVEMEFLIQRDGSVRDIQVVAAQPTGTFNAAAQSTLRRWRFVPIQRDGRAVEQRAWLRMRFTATETEQRARR
jgi:protein TonB